MKLTASSSYIERNYDQQCTGIILLLTVTELWSQWISLSSSDFQSIATAPTNSMMTACNPCSFTCWHASHDHSRHDSNTFWYSGSHNERSGHGKGVTLSASRSLRCKLRHFVHRLALPGFWMELQCDVQSQLLQNHTIVSMHSFV